MLPNYVPCACMQYVNQLFLCLSPRPGSAVPTQRLGRTPEDDYHTRCFLSLRVDGGVKSCDHPTSGIGEGLYAKRRCLFFILSFRWTMWQDS